MSNRTNKRKHNACHFLQWYFVSKFVLTYREKKFVLVIEKNFCKYFKITKGQLISKYPFGVIVWTKIATKKFDNFCHGGQIKKIKSLYYIKYPMINTRKCLYFFDLTTRAEIVKFFRCYFGPNDFFQKAF